jgi:hypothetical protein
MFYLLRRRDLVPVLSKEELDGQTEGDANELEQFLDRFDLNKKLVFCLLLNFDILNLYPKALKPGASRICRGMSS